MKRVVLAIACSALISACPSSDDSGDDQSPDAGQSDVPKAGNGGSGGKAAGSGGSSGSGGSTSPAGTEVVGHITVKATAPTPATPVSKEKIGSTSVGGKIYDGPLPEETVWDEVDDAGGCKLLTPRAPFCDPPCGSAVCVEDDQCQDSPMARNVGVLHVKGLKTTTGETEFDVKPINNSYANDADATLPFPAFEEGDEISFTSSGGDYAPISATLEAIAPLELLQGQAFALAKDEPLSIAWNKPASGATSRIHVLLDISHHGGSRGKIECDVEDTGTLEIDAELMTQLIDLGVAGFPTVIVTRSAVATAQIQAGLVEFAVTMDREHSVTVPGLTSCVSNTDCEDGQECQTDLSCK